MRELAHIEGRCDVHLEHPRLVYLLGIDVTEGVGLRVEVVEDEKVLVLSDNVGEYGRLLQL